MLTKIKRFFQEQTKETEDFFGSDFKEGIKALGLFSILWVTVNVLFIVAVYKLYHIQEPHHREIIDIMILMIATPLLLMEAFAWFFSLLDRRPPFSLFTIFNLFYGFAVFHYLVVKPVKMIFDRETEENVEADPPYYFSTFDAYESFRSDSIELETKQRGVPLKSMNLWSEISQMEKFTEKYFQKSQSLVRFLKERLHRPGGNQLDWDFFLFSLVIPKRKLLSVEGLKHILMSYPGLDSNPYWETIPTMILKEEILEEAFSLYDEKALKKLLCRRYKAQDFLETIELINKRPQVLPLVESFCELKTFLRSQEFLCLHHPALKNIHNLKIKNYQFLILSKEEEYELWAEKLENCIHRTYWEKDDVDIIGIFKDNQFYAALSFRSGKFEQIKRKKNLEVSITEGKHILDLLRSYLKNDTPQTTPNPSDL